jgi:hypothetical protein
VNVESSESLKASPASERWTAYYQEAKVKRRARGPSGRSSQAYRRWRTREQILITSALLSLGVLVTICYAVLEH